MFTGVLLGLGAAMAQSVYYLLSGRYGMRFQASALSLLVRSHVLMAGMALLLLPWFWSPLVLQPERWLVPLVTFNLFYLAAQFCLFQALRHVEASRISSLLGLKIVLLALGTFLVSDTDYSVWQWGAVGLCTLAALWLSRSGGAIRLSGLIWTLTTVICYALSDWYVQQLLARFDDLAFVQRAILATLLGFIFCGLLLSSLLPHVPTATRKHWLHCVPIAGCWLLAMLLLVVRIGLQAAEALPAPAVLLRRGLAASLMLMAIALFYLDGEAVRASGVIAGGG